MVLMGNDYSINSIILHIKCSTLLDHADIFFYSRQKLCKPRVFADHWNLVILKIHHDLRHFWQPWGQ